MSKPPRRSFFQIHLSTAIVLMFVAGALMWVNSAKRLTFTLGNAFDATINHYESKFVTEDKFLRDGTGPFWDGNKDFDYGWPCVAMHYSETVLIAKSGAYLDVRGFTNNWSFGKTVLNTLTGLSILFATYFLCEWLIRLRESQA